MGNFWISLSFHREDNKISIMTKYAEFITYFPLEKLTKIFNLCKKGAKMPLFSCHDPYFDSYLKTSFMYFTDRIVR